jgi:4'-phosphopantetheinyl transferase
LSSASQQLFSRPPELAKGQVALWIINYSQTSDIDAIQLKGLLSHDELQRNARLGHPGHQKRNAVCLGSLRKLLCHYLEISNAQLTLSRSENGKPQIYSPHSEIQFNYSHSGDYAAIALCHGPRIGVDIEYCRRNNDLEAISQHYFAASEVVDLSALPETQQRRRFFQYWTLKEAYIKARGEGIYLGLDNFSFDLSDNKRGAISVSFSSESFDSTDRWQFLQYESLDDYLVSVAVEASSPDYSLETRCRIDT